MEVTERLMQKISQALCRVVSACGYSCARLPRYLLAKNRQLSSREHPDRLYQTSDQTTDTILEMIAGYTDPDTVRAVLKYTCVPDELAGPLPVWYRDAALYEAIWQLYLRHHLPKLRFEDYPSLGRKTEEGRYFFRQHTIHFYHKLFARLLAYQGDEFYRMLRRVLISKLIAELTHVDQLTSYSLYAQYIEDQIKLILPSFLGGYPFVEYKYTYQWPGTLEYDAHQVRQSKIEQEFVDLYLQAASKHGLTPHRRLFLASLYDGYFLLPAQDADDTLTASFHFVDLTAAHAWSKLPDRQG